ncbi:hypothetical protein H5410_007233 [Solanum commersonii]|uniref:Uncharacterized protein n=1 Tax=Solanum commersonii TaxID=4109 RepID=A0A9J6ADJ5_SOLCO|nr:hypothetical protein H5410_007233 [Solanum commersonii]
MTQKQISETPFAKIPDIEKCLDIVATLQAKKDSSEVTVCRAGIFELLSIEKKLGLESITLMVENCCCNYERVLERLAVQYVSQRMAWKLLKGCAIGDVSGPIIVAFCFDKVLHLELR